MIVVSQFGSVPLNENAISALVELGYSQSEAQTLVKDAMAKLELDTVLKQRQQAYNKEADPLFIEAQFDGTPEAEQKWRDKIAEIKARYPKPAA